MKKNIFITGLTISVCFINHLLSAQISKDSLNAIYERETIYLVDGGAMTNKYVKNNVKKKGGFLWQKLNKEFTNSSAEAKLEMKAGMGKQKRAILLLGTSVVVLAATIILLPEIAAGLALTGLGLAFVTDMAALANAVQVPKHLNKAIWLHNGDALTGM